MLERRWMIHLSPLEARLELNFITANSCLINSLSLIAIIRNLWKDLQNILPCTRNYSCSLGFWLSWNHIQWPTNFKALLGGEIKLISVLGNKRSSYNVWMLIFVKQQATQLIRSLDYTEKNLLWSYLDKAVHPSIYWC